MSLRTTNACILEETDQERFERRLKELASPNLTTRGLVNAVCEIEAIEPNHGRELIDPDLLTKFEVAKTKVLAGKQLPYGERVHPKT